MPLPFQGAFLFYLMITIECPSFPYISFSTFGQLNAAVAGCRQALTDRMPAVKKFAKLLQANSSAVCIALEPLLLFSSFFPCAECRRAAKGAATIGNSHARALRCIEKALRA
jgi:hypothetical protein